MPAPPALLQFFSSSSRARGETYALENRVRLLEVSPTVIDAVVRGREDYDVRLRYALEPGARTQEVEISCTCPHYYDGDGTCKHIWATIVAASDREGTFLNALEGARTGSVSVVPGDLAELDDADDDLLGPDDEDPSGVAPGATAGRVFDLRGRPSEWTFGAPTGLTSRSPSPARPAAARPAAPPKSPGRKFVEGVAKACVTRPPDLPAFRQRRDELIYVIDLDRLHQGAGLHLEILARQRKKDGAWSEPKPARLSPFDLAQASAADAEIVAGLAGANQAAGLYGGYALTHVYPVPTPLARLMVPLVARTGRAHIRISTAARTVLHPVGWDDGPPWAYAVLAEPRGDDLCLSGGFQRDGQTLPREDVLTVLESGFLLTPAAIARAELPPSRELFSGLLASREVVLSSEEAATLAELLATHGRTWPGLPPALQVPEIDVAPTRRITLSATRSWGSRDQLAAVVTFDYDGTIVAEGEPPTPIWDPEHRRIVRRRLTDEDDARQRLTDLGVTRKWNSYERVQEWRVSAAAMPRIVGALVAEGWRVEAEGRLLQRPSRVSLSVASGIDWFDLQATVEFAGEMVPLTEVLAALKKGEFSVRLGDGTFGLLPEEWLDRYAPLAAMGDVEGDRLRFRLPQAALLDALLAAQADDVAVAVDQRFEAARQALSTFDRVTPADPPASFEGTLRPYQKDGLGWLGFLRRFGFGGCLADDMGLGKTVMVLAMLDAWRQERLAGGEPPRPSLVVAPRSLVHNWMAEAARFTPALRVRDCSHVTRRSAGGLWEDVDVAIATYGTLRRDIGHLKDREFDYVILDEAQAIKNANTASAKAARLLQGRHRLALSGTPIENHLGELWSLIEFLNPGLLGRSSAFLAAGAGRRTLEAETALLLSRAVRPFILRRTKAEVATDLPERTEQTILCELEGKQRTLYESLRTHYREALLGRIARVGLGKSKLQVLEALLRLRQAACHPGLIDAALSAGPAAKLDVLIPRLREVVAEGHKAIVFSQFTSLLALVKAALDDEPISYEYLDGKTRDRAARVDRFQTDPACRLFLVSLKAGGLGLNLTAADYVFLLDPWWNPAVEAQAIDRAHRIGQTQHVFAYRLIAADTVEEKVLELQQTKRALADAILRADAGLIGQLGREDVELLLS